MRRLLPFLLLLLASPAFAALTVSQNASVMEAPPSVAFGSSVASGSVIVATTQNDTNPCASETVSDSVNSGSYTLLSSWGGNPPCIYWKVANATGTPTVSVSGTSGTVVLSIAQVTGWVGTPTADTSLTETWTATSATLTVSPLATSQNNEILIADASYYGGAYGTAAAAGWTVLSSAPNAPYWNSGSPGYAIEATAGTSIPLSATISASETWYLTLGGVYDYTTAPAAAAVMPPRFLGVGFGYSSGGGGLALSGSPAAPTIGSLYSASLTPSGGSGTGYACSQVSATPNTYQWLSITPSCQLQGIPEYAETESITDQVTDSAGNTATKTFTITPATSGSLTVVSATTLPNVTDNGAFAYHILLSGGSGTYDCNNAYDTQPVVITPDCWILGTPTATGAVSLGTVTVYDAQTGASTTWTPSLTVDSTLRLQGLDSDTNQINLPPAHKGDYWQYTITPYGGTSPYTCSVTAGLPGWATLSGCTLSGTPTASGNVAMTLKAVDSASGSISDAALLNISSATTVSRPSYNSSPSNGFFVLNQNLYDPNGHLFVMDGVDRVHYDSASWASGTNGALSGANAVREFFGFGQYTQTPAQMVTQITDEYVDNGIVPIVTVAALQTGFTGSISGTTLAVSAIDSTVSTSNAAILWSSYNSTIAGITGSGITTGTYISSQLTGTSGDTCPASDCNGTTGTYQVSASQTVGSETITEDGATSSGYDANMIVGATNMLVSAYSGELSTVQGNILINIANEWGTSTQCGAGSDSGFVSAYETAISTLRTAGYTAPIVIDLPCEGEDYGAFVSGGYAASIIASDPLKNVIFSAHLYNTTSTAGQVTNITHGTNAVITFNSSASSNPWSALTNFNGTVCLWGVAGMTQINGTCPTVTSFGGSSGAWTLTTNLNTSSYGTWTGGGIVTDGYYYQNRVNALATLAAGGLPVMVGEFGPPGAPAACPSTGVPLDNQSVAISTLIAALRAAGISEVYWAWDDGHASNQVYWSCDYGVAGATGTAYTNGQYVPSAPSSLSSQGMDVVTNPRTGLLSGGVPATVLH